MSGAQQRTVQAEGGACFHAARALLEPGTALALSQFLPQQERLFVAYCRSGSGHVAGDGVEAELAAGQLMLLRTPIAARLHAVDTLDVTFVGFPKTMVTARLGRVEPMVGATAAIPNGFALMFDGLAVAVARGAHEACPRYDAILRSATDFALALVENLVPAGLGMTTHAQLLLARAKQIVNTRLDDPAFGTSALATTLGVGARYLRILFAADGLTASDYIAAQRLRRGRRLLTDQAHRHRPVADIARASGFVSQSHFARLIRHRFGLSPTALRAAHEISRQITPARAS
jgi:AraC-like DNA-binding protein